MLCVFVRGRTVPLHLLIFLIHSQAQDCGKEADRFKDVLTKNKHSHIRYRAYHSLSGSESLVAFGFCFISGTSA